MSPPWAQRRLLPGRARRYPKRGLQDLSHSQDPRKLSEDTLGERLPRPGRNLHRERVQGRLPLSIQAVYIRELHSLSSMQIFALPSSCTRQEHAMGLLSELRAQRQGEPRGPLLGCEARPLLL